MTGTSFKTTTKAQEVKPGQPLVPIAITINDRAATRESIIRKVRSLGHQFVERSKWGATPAKAGMESDWDYSMVAFHHAGRSYSSGHGGDQMRDTQEEQLDKKYDDIAYHFGIDLQRQLSMKDGTSV